MTPEVGKQGWLKVCGLKGFTLVCFLTTGMVLMYLASQKPLRFVPAKNYILKTLADLPTPKLDLSRYWASSSSDNTTTIEPPIPRASTLQPHGNQQQQQRQPRQPKLILWDPVLYWQKVPAGPEMFSKCEVKDCYFATSRKEAAKLGTPDAVIISANYMGKAPPTKPKGQVWIFTTHESPVTLREFRKAKWKYPSWKGKIDLTMVYRLDSDFPVPYGKVERTGTVVPRNYTEILAKKKKMAAQVSSRHCNCQSRRREYISLMKKHTSVDVFGRCGSGRCKDCFAIINETYKFYLSFENSLCEGYVTEKFFRTSSWNVVPVVRGIVDYSRFFPRDSYIDTRDFKSPKALAQFLNYLDRNDTAYLAFLKAKEGFQVKTGAPVFQEAYCKVCEYLHSPASARSRNGSFDFVQWWDEKTSCLPPRDLVDE